MTQRQRRKREKVRRHEPRDRPDRLGRQIATGAGVTVGATLLMGGVAQAVCTCTVDSLADPTDTGHTTLRDAMISADANPGSAITFASGLSGTITLGSELPAINYPTIIQGPGASQLAVSGDDASRIFYLNGFDGAQATTISGLTITGGSASGGAGILSFNMDLTLDGVVLSDNHVTGLGRGGGLEADLGGSLAITNSTISGNTAATGGGIYTHYQSGITTTISSSTISGNGAPSSNSGLAGGAYFDYTSPATVANSTIYGNSAFSRGGGLYHYGQTGGPGLTITGSTITHNTAGARGGGVVSNGGAGYTQPSFQNTIVAGNSAPTGPDVSANEGTMNAAFSLIQTPDPATTINQTGPDILGQDPQLGPLAGNSGTTMTQKPSPSSPAIDKGAAFGFGADQRGLARIFDVPSIANASGGDGSDMGAVELQAGDIPPAPAPVATPQKKKKKCKKKKGKKGSAQSAKKKCKKKKKK